MSDRPRRQRAVLRAHRCLIRWGMLKHPHGRDYAKENIGVLGGKR